ncbi:MAG: hypothetical protein JWM96_493 [Alphaproteobacteria bacterium]|nr:hypothetical protein [Alphaproteobacteria bacterium]
MSHSYFLSDEPSFYSNDSDNAEPFPSAEAAWFWCVQTSEAIHSGARLKPGRATTPRPCEAVDIQKVVLRLADKKILTKAHVRAMVAYGPRHLRPSQKIHAAAWSQAMERLTPYLQQKGIVA